MQCGRSRCVPRPPLCARGREINGLQGQRDNELQSLEARRTLANNNLAGATYLQSISTQMQAVNDTYRTRIDVARSCVDQHRKDVTDLRKQLGELGK